MGSRRDFLHGVLASGVVLALPRRSWAGTHYAFVKFEANGTVVTGNTDITNIGGETLDRAEWIQCKRVTYGLKRDIGTGARVSGHTHYDRIEFDCPQGPSTPMLETVQSNGLGVNVSLYFYENESRKGDPMLKITGPGWIESLSVGRSVSGTFYFTEPVSSRLAEKAAALTAG